MVLLPQVPETCASAISPLPHSKIFKVFKAVFSFKSWFLKTSFLIILLIFLKINLFALFLRQIKFVYVILTEKGAFMEELYFREMSLEDKEKVIEYINEFVAYGSVINGFSGASSAQTFEELFAKQQKNKSYTFVSYDQEERSPQETYLLVRKNDERIVGTFNIRLYLTRALDESMAGHIGYGIRPSERRKGYASEGLRMALEEFKKRGVKAVRLGCFSENIGSKKAILNNGGKLIAHKNSLMAEDYYEITLG